MTEKMTRFVHKDMNLKEGGSYDCDLSSILRAINRIPPLAPQEERELARHARNGNNDALRRLVNANLRYVVSLAKQYSGQGVPIRNLINRGTEALVRAARRYDERRGIRFISYAGWPMREAMLHSMVEYSRIERLLLDRMFNSPGGGRVHARSRPQTPQANRGTDD